LDGASDVATWICFHDDKDGLSHGPKQLLLFKY